MNKVFAWQWGSRGPTPVLFHQGIPVAPETNKPRVENLLKIVPLSANLVDKSLDELAELFPYEQAA